MGAKSSIHTQAGHGGYVSHNDRSQKTVNSIFPENKNEIWNYQKEAFSLYRSELAARSEAYTKRTGQKLQAKAITHLSAVVNLNEHHTLKDVRKVADYLEKTFDTKVFQIAVHRDEGHVNDKGEKIVNYHAHIEYMGLDTKGQSVRKKLTKSALTKLQSNTAELLGMERGRNYAKERAPRPKRLDTYEYKNKAEALQKQRQQTKKTEQGKAEALALAKLKDVQAENTRLRALLKERGSKRSDYQILEKTIRELKERARAKDLSINELKSTQKELLRRLDISTHAKQPLEAKIAVLEAKIEKLMKTLDFTLRELDIPLRGRDDIDDIQKALATRIEDNPKILLKHFKAKLVDSNNLKEQKYLVARITELHKQIKAESLQEKQKVRDKSKGREL